MLQAIRRQAASSPDSIGVARRALLLLTVLAVVGPILAASASTLTNLWTYQALKEAEAWTNTLRVHADIDQLHDAVRGDVVTAALLHRSDGFEEHASALEQGVRRMQVMQLPQEIADPVHEIGPRLLAYVASARRAMQGAGGPTSPEVEHVTAQWRALQPPLTQISNQLQQRVIDAEQRGRTTYNNGNLLRLLAVLVVVGGILLAGHRISRAVLTTSYELADATVRARRASQSRADFLAAMSHEIRTPMTGVLGMVDLLAAEDLGARQRGYVDGLRASGRHLLNVINDILDFARIESGRLELETIDLSLPDLLERVRSLMHPMAVERGLALQMHVDPHSPPVLTGDPTRIQQVLINLVGNAIKFTERGSVAVDVRQVALEGPGLRFRFEVRDSGIGIPAEHQADLFSAFRQADETIARRFGGSGLGLAICKRLVEAMGGSIGVRSAPGEGSTFFFELPMGLGNAERLSTRARKDRAPLPPRRILVAEDVEINRRILSATLERAGHALAFAHDGAQAVALARERTFDLILMDVQMPVMDGVEATRRIRALAGPKGRVPILALTANVMTQERERYLSAGMDGCLTKPIEWDELFAAIARAAPHPEGLRESPPAATAPAQPLAAVPALVDESVVARLEEMAGRDVVREWMQSGMRGYDRALEAMTQDGVPLATLAAEAHKLRGSGSTLGLPRIGALGARIEEAANGGTVTSGLVAELASAVQATRAELDRRSLL